MTSEGDTHRIATKAWLAPFDLGISQRVEMSAVPTDVKAIYAIHLDLELLSGQRRAWRRANFAFFRWETLKRILREF